MIHKNMVDGKLAKIAVEWPCPLPQKPLAEASGVTPATTIRPLAQLRRL